MENDDPEVVQRRIWDQAVSTFNSTLTRDPRKHILPSQSAFPKKSYSLESLADETKEAYRLCYTRNTPWVANVNAVLQAVNKYALVVDVLIQHQPHITALAWGLTRLVIQVSVSDIELGEEFGRNLQEISLHIVRYQIEAKFFADEARVLNSISLLFSQIVNYLVRVNRHVPRSRVIRSARAAFSSKFSRISREINLRALEVDSEITIASKARQINSNEAAKAEYANQETFRQECKSALARIEALDPQKETCELKNMLYELSNCLRYQRRDDAQEDVRTVVGWLTQRAPQADVVPPREPGTCAWIFRHEIYLRWSGGEDRQCLWIHGIPGSGKSVLSSYLIEEASRQLDVVLRYSFHHSLDHKSALSTPFVLSLLLQLCSNKTVTAHPGFPQILEKITKLVNLSKQGLEWGFTSLQSILDSVLDWLPSYVLVIDGLDDYVGENGLLEVGEYLRRVGSHQNSRVVVLSRVTKELKEVFACVTQISMDCVENLRDIENYVHQRINREPRLHKLRGKIIAKAYESGRGMFLWATLMLDGLQQCLGTLRALEDYLSHTPYELFDVYEKRSADHCASLGPEARAKRYEILLILLGMCQPLSVQDISAALALDSSTDLSDEKDELLEPEAEIDRLCRPLVTVVGPTAQFVHNSVKEFLIERKMSKEDSNVFLARKTLSKLSRAQYKEWKYAASILRKNLLAGSIIGNPLKRPLEESVFYNYACLHWHEHVTALTHPPEDILEKLATFLTGTEFVTWSEVLFELRNRAGLGPLIQVRLALVRWYKDLPEPIQARVPIGKFFVVPHEYLSSELNAKAQDKLLPYLPLIRLGAYFNVGGQSGADWQKAYNYKRTVAEGFEDLLGHRNPITLRVRTAMLQEFFWQKRFPEAKRELLEVAKVQKEVLGDEDIDYWITLQLLGLAEFFLTKFEEARGTLTRSEKGLSELLGRSNIYLLMTKLYKAYVLERQGQLSQAFELYDSIQQEWAPGVGQSHPFSLMLETALGSVSRKQKRFDFARECLLEAWEARERIFTIEVNICIDSALQLALTYREAECPDDAQKLLRRISGSGVFETDFERYCQHTHIHALVLLDCSQYLEARMMLERLLASDRDQNNRELLWVRLDLARILREHGERDEAVMLFAEIVEPIPQQRTAQESSQTAEDPSSPFSLYEELEPVKRLEVAEQALKLVRAAKLDEAEDLLLREGLRWVKQEDFWILQGGPITDTAT